MYRDLPAADDTDAASAAETTYPRRKPEDVFQFGRPRNSSAGASNYDAVETAGVSSGAEEERSGAQDSAGGAMQNDDAAAAGESDFYYDDDYDYSAFDESSDVPAPNSKTAAGGSKLLAALDEAYDYDDYSDYTEGDGGQDLTPKSRVAAAAPDYDDLFGKR